jgi:pimeloyl-ACP methyl ester carboxylesterase
VLNDLGKFDTNGAAVALESPSCGSATEGRFAENSELHSHRVAIRPLFFNPEPKRLFGVYYEPATDRPAGSPVLVCPPIGHEYVRTYNVIRKLCGRLAASGFAVLKFDYSGLGDSYGDGSTADVAEWRENIRAAATELCKHSGETELTIVGLRFGAALAAGIRLEGASARSLVLWDPIVDGARYIEELQQLHLACLADTLRFRKSQTHRRCDGELLGFRFPARLQESMSRLSLLDKPFPYNNCFLITSSQTPEYETFAQSLNRNTRGRFTREFVSEPCGWDDYRQVETALTANRAVAAVTAKIAGGFV